MIFSFTEDVFCTGVTVIIKESFDRVKKEIKKHDKNYTPEDDVLEAVTFQFTDKKTCIIWFKNKPTIKTIVHECMHVTWHMMDVNGMNLSEETQETYCYYIDYLVGKIMIYGIYDVR